MTSEQPQTTVGEVSTPAANPRGSSTVDRGGASHPLVELTLTRLREFVREPEALFWAFVFPILMTIVMALAFPSSGTRPVPVAIADGPNAAAVRRALAGDPSIAIRDIAPGGEQGALREGAVHLIVVPADPPIYQFDPAREESRVARLVVDNALKKASGRLDPWRAHEQPVQIPGSRYVDWLIPGLVAMGIMTNGMWGIAFAIVQARLRKLLKRMLASPMRKWEFLFAQVGARLIFLAPEVAIPLAFGALALGMPIHGSFVAIAAVSLLGAVTFGAIGLLLGSRVRTFEAVSGLMNLATVPMWLLSGVFFSTSNFPDAFQPAIQALPLTALVDALRAVVLEGRSLIAIRGELALLGAWTIVPFVLALRLFKWR
ncbi:MAG TPA: ABC transporter permease [Vicinamibacterales bacterium]|nr:ABC transporter permease [Vicinamibacterales bacterium]